MNIKKYFTFIGENLNESEESIGEKIEKLASGNDYLLNIISGYTKEVDPTIRLSNAINLLSKENQKFLLKEVEEYIKMGEDDGKKVDAIAYTSVDLNENQSHGGKNLFKSFLKIITALGQKEVITADWEKTPKNYLVVFKTEMQSMLEIKSVMSRYEFFSNFINQIDYTHNECKLYYAIGLDMTLEYGIVCDGQKVIFGTFKISKGIFNWLLTLDSQSSTPLKRIIVGLGCDRLELMCRIKKDMQDFTPGTSEHKTNPKIDGDVISFGYHGLGKWDNGVLDQGEWMNAKQNLKNFLMKFKWSDKVRIGVSWDQFWIYFNIKLK